MDHVYGPVPSRRLGMSLGVDPIPKLVCTFDCVYCQLGKKRAKVSQSNEIRYSFPSASQLVREIQDALCKHSTIDYITFSGSGEPTLTPHLAQTASKLRRITDIPLALITNSSLLPNPKVFEATTKFDLVLPSLDAGDQQTFLQVNRPAHGFEIDSITSAIKKLARKVPVWLETMLVQLDGFTNTTPESLDQIAAKIRDIQPRQVLLNTCVRPPQIPMEPIPREKLQQIRKQLEQQVPEVPISLISIHSDAQSTLTKGEINEEIINTVQIRPCTIVDLSDSLGINPAEIGKRLAQLIEQEKINRVEQNGQTHYMTKGG